MNEFIMYLHQIPEDEIMNYCMPLRTFKVLYKGYDIVIFEKEISINVEGQTLKSSTPTPFEILEEKKVRFDADKKAKAENSLPPELRAMFL